MKSKKIRIHDISISLDMYLSMIGADVITTQSCYKGEWEAKLVSKENKKPFGYTPAMRDNTHEPKVQECSSKSAKTPNDAIEDLCRMISRGKIYREGIWLKFLFEEVTP